MSSIGPCGILDIEEYSTDVEPVLFPNDENFNRYVSGEADYEKNLDILIELVEIQNKMGILMERIEKGNALVLETQNKLDTFKSGHRVSKTIWNAWVARIKELRSHLSIIWGEWWILQAQAKNLVGKNKSVWSTYFRFVEGEPNPLNKLLNEELNLYWSISDPEEIDNQAWLKGGTYETMEGYLDTHLLEMREYSKPFNENPYLARDWWDERRFLKSQREIAELNSLLAMMPAEFAEEFIR